MVFVIKKKIKWKVIFEKVVFFYLVLDFVLDLLSL